MSQDIAPASSIKDAVEDFLFLEAALQDDWKLDDWFSLFAPGATYHVPSSGGTMDDDPATQLFYIADDYVRLRERIVRLKDNGAHSEFPRSIVQHMISNVRVLGTDGDGHNVECNFMIHRAKNRIVNTYFGRSRYRLLQNGTEFKILSKRSHLAMDMLYPGKISILI